MQRQWLCQVSKSNNIISEMTSRPKEEYHNYIAVNLDDQKTNAKGDLVVDVKTDFSWYGVIGDIRTLELTFSWQEERED